MCILKNIILFFYHVHRYFTISRLKGVWAVQRCSIIQLICEDPLHFQTHVLYQRKVSEQNSDVQLYSCSVKTHYSVSRLKGVGTEQWCSFIQLFWEEPPANKTIFFIHLWIEQKKLFRLIIHFFYYKNFGKKNIVTILCSHLNGQYIFFFINSPYINTIF